MTPTPSFHPENLHMLRFQLVREQIEGSVEIETELVRSFSFTVDFDTSFKVAENLAKADLTIDVSTQSDPSQTEARGQFHFVCLYQVDNLNVMVQAKEKGVLEVNSELANALASITYSTSRGMLITRLQGTALADFILPVINPGILLEKG